jgi:MoxR-like ATPase
MENKNDNRIVQLMSIICGAGEVPILVGNAGVGKTQMVHQLAKKTDKNVTTLIISQMEPEDLMGMPAKDLENKVTVWLRPDWWPTEKNNILFLDEIARAKSDVKNAILQLLTDRRLGDHKLPEDTWIIAAMNPSNDRFDQEEVFDSAFIDRFVWISTRVDSDQWINWAKVNSLDYSIIEFIRTEAQHLGGDEDFELPEIKPSPRSWHKLSNIMKKVSEETFSEFGYAIASGLLGTSAASSFMESWTTRQKRLRPEELWDNTKATLDMIKTMEIHNVNEFMHKMSDYLAKCYEDKTLDNIDIQPMTELMKILPAEPAAIIARYIEDTKTDSGLAIYRHFRKSKEFLVAFSKASNKSSTTCMNLDGDKLETL